MPPRDRSPAPEVPRERDPVAPGGEPSRETSRPSPGVARSDVESPAATSRTRGVSAAHFYYENGYLVLTEAGHLARGYCCGSGCRHCPWREG